jgi:hypothetical protein
MYKWYMQKKGRTRTNKETDRNVYIFNKETLLLPIQKYGYTSVITDDQCTMNVLRNRVERQ